MKRVANWPWFASWPTRGMVALCFYLTKVLFGTTNNCMKLENITKDWPDSDFYIIVFSVLVIYLFGIYKK